MRLDGGETHSSSRLVAPYEVVGDICDSMEWSSSVSYKVRYTHRIKLQEMRAIKREVKARSQACRKQHRTQLMCGCIGEGPLEFFSTQWCIARYGTLLYCGASISGSCLGADRQEPL